MIGGTHHESVYINEMSMHPPPTPVCLKGHGNMEKFIHYLSHIFNTQYFSETLCSYLLTQRRRKLTPQLIIKFQSNYVCAPSGQSRRGRPYVYLLSLLFTFKASVSHHIRLKLVHSILWRKKENVNKNRVAYFQGDQIIKKLHPNFQKVAKTVCKPKYLHQSSI